MRVYIMGRVASLLPVLFIVSLVVFGLMYIVPGGPAAAMLGLEADAERIAALNADLGFDRPFYVRYTEWIVGVAVGDWGESFFLEKSVLAAIGEYFGPTFSLAVMAQCLSLAISIPLGTAAARLRGSVCDMAAVTLSMVGAALPGFLLSMFLVLVFSVYLRWLPVAGYAPLSDGLWRHIEHLLLPALSLGMVHAAYITRMTRSSMLDVMYQNSIRTARAKGLGEIAVLFGHALKNAAPVILTAAGQSFGSLITGAIVTETLFGIPGLGMLTMGAIGRRDIFVIQGVVLFVTLLYVLVNLAVDIMYAVVDPRMRGGMERGGR